MAHQWKLEMKVRKICIYRTTDQTKTTEIETKFPLKVTERRHLVTLMRTSALSTLHRLVSPCPQNLGGTNEDIEHFKFSIIHLMRVFV